MSLENTNIPPITEDDDIQSEAGSSATDVAGSSASDVAGSSASDVADLSDFDLSEEEDAEPDKNPEEEYSNKIDTSISHPASYSQLKALKKGKQNDSGAKVNDDDVEEEEEDDEDDEDDEDEKEDYLQKFDKNFRNEFVKQYHPESNTHNYEEVKMRTLITLTGETISDEGHKTLPFLTKYEKTRVLGQRAKQINAGAKPLVAVPDNVMDGYVIANLELEQKKIPFIIKRPLPNGECEYWNLADLELMD
jgi:DNA-directed RNA polymerase I, II, and III subunit RPABC2